MTKTLRIALLCAVAVTIASGQADAGGGVRVKTRAEPYRLKGKGARDIARLARKLPLGKRHELVRYDGGEVDGRPMNGLLVRDADGGLVFERHFPAAHMQITTPSGLRIDAVMPEEVHRFKVAPGRFSLKLLGAPAAEVPRDIAAQVRAKHLPAR